MPLDSNLSTEPPITVAVIAPWMETALTSALRGWWPTTAVQDACAYVQEGGSPSAPLRVLWRLPSASSATGDHSEHDALVLGPVSLSLTPTLTPPTVSHLFLCHKLSSGTSACLPSSAVCKQASCAIVQRMQGEDLFQFWDDMGSHFLAWETLQREMDHLQPNDCLVLRRLEPVSTWSLSAPTTARSETQKAGTHLSNATSVQVGALA
jgi:hypothetical protein